MIQHILFPTDASQQSHKSLAYVELLATTFKAHVTIVHGYMYANAAALMSAAGKECDSLSEMHREAKTYIQHYFDQVRQQLASQGIAVETSMMDGDAGPLIVKTALEKQCDLIIMGSRGLGAVQSFLVGSVSNYVLHHTKCPILMIPSDD